MSQISRLKDAEISNGNLINADDIDVEMNQLVNESNGQDTRISSLESQDVSIDGVKTFLKSPKTDGLSEKTLGNGINVESVLIKSGTIQLDSQIDVASVDTGLDEITTSITHGLATADLLMFKTDGTLPAPLSLVTIYYARVISASTLTLHPTESDATGNTNKIDLTTTGTGNYQLLADPPSLSEGQVWYNQPEKKLKTYQNSLTKNILLEGDASNFPTNYLKGRAIDFVSASSIKIPNGLSCRDTTDSFNIVFSSDTIIDITTSGANGLDTGAEASNTWYYVYAITDSTGVNSAAGLLSTVNESNTGSITLPSGYDKKRQLPMAVRNDGVSDFLNFYVAEGWPNRPKIMYNQPFTDAIPGSNTDPTNVLNGGSAATFTDIDCSAYIPPIATVGLFHCFSDWSSAHLSLRKDGETHIGKHVHQLANNTVNDVMIATSATQIIEYDVDAGDFNISVSGFVITEVN